MKTTNERHIEAAQLLAAIEQANSRIGSREMRQRPGAIDMRAEPDLQRDPPPVTRSQGGALMLHYDMIRHQFEAYMEATHILASNHTTVAGRASAIAIKDGFIFDAPRFVGQLLAALKELRDITEGEECASPETCNAVNGLCCRCRIRELVPSQERQISECCHEPHDAGDRFCRKCGWEFRAVTARHDCDNGLCSIVAPGAEV